MWWPPVLAVLGALTVVLVKALGDSPANHGVVGPVVAVCVIAAGAGMLTGVGEGLVQPPQPIQLRVRLVLVTLVLLAAATLRGGTVAAGLAALVGSGVALILHWCGSRAMSALVGRDDDQS
jgi:hypothetical protein